MTENNIAESKITERKKVWKIIFQEKLLTEIKMNRK